MPLYEYKAYDVSGKMAAGLIDAASITTAHARLKSQGLFPTNITADTGKTHNSNIPIGDLLFSLEQLATLLKADIPLPQALESMVGQINNDELKRAYARVKVHLEEGKSFATSLALEPRFPKVLVKMIEAGETVGAVDKILERFIHFMEKESSFKEKVVSSMMYPIIIMVASFGLIFFIITYIAPTLVKVFASFHQEMPLPTKIMLATGSFLRQNTILIFIILGFSIFAYLKLLPATFKDTLKMKIPVFGMIHVNSQMSRWARTLSMLHGGGVNMIKALSSAREVVDNVVIKEDLKMIEEYVQKGENLGSAMSRIPTMPNLIVQMTKTGEKSGELEKLLNTAALFYEKEIDKNLSMFFKFLEPATIVFLGLVIGFVAVSALLPIFKINQLMK